MNAGPFILWVYTRLLKLYPAEYRAEVQRTRVHRGSEQPKAAATA